MYISPRIDRNRDYSEGVPVGCAFPNEHVFLLDDNNQEVTKPGIAGDLCPGNGAGSWLLSDAGTDGRALCIESAESLLSGTDQNRRSRTL